jgi:hypothetical protein
MPRLTGRAFRSTRKSRKNAKGAILSFNREISNTYESEERL